MKLRSPKSLLIPVSSLRAHFHPTRENSVRIQIACYCLALTGGYTVAGIALAACRAPLLVWLINSLIVLYLSVAGKGALALANLWLALLLAYFTVRHPWPDHLDHWLGLYTPQIWSLTLLSLWAIAVIVTFVLAFASSLLQERGWLAWDRFIGLSGLSLFSLGMGRLLLDLWLRP
jgi:hypothetical protein